jgi:ribonuclease HIII
VSQETLVYKVRPEHAALIEGRVDPAQFEFRSVPYARFSAKGEGVVVTLYTSGKLVVQGAGAALFAERYAPEAAAVKSKSKAKKSAAKPRAVAPDTVCVGSDECGKGDFLGPLVVCAARMTPEEARGLIEAGVMDSKALDDKKALVLGAFLRERLEHCVVRLDPTEYNPRWRAKGNLNELLGDLHSEAIRGVVRVGDHVIIDRFAREELMEKRLEGLEISILQRTKAEEELCVAAASIIAREAFLVALDELSAEWGIEMRKGAGPPVDNAAREFVRSFGVERLEEVAKVHFKNAKRVVGG